VTILRQQATKRKLLPSFGNITGFVINPRPSDHSMTLPAGLPLRSPAAEISICIRHQHLSSAANKATGNREFPGIPVFPPLKFPAEIPGEFLETGS